MKQLKSYEIRQMWLDFWQTKGHEVIPSASLIPHDDPTVLWINAGVTPLKKYFDGSAVPRNRRMVNAQKSIRTNDIENVGLTARHHTFFEMLGNFSVGDYFKEEAVTWAFELLTSPAWFALPLERLYFTVHTADQKTAALWESLGVPAAHIIPLAGNFWEIGEGPCGPDTEIFFDRGPQYDPEGKGVALLKEEIENDRYIELYNIVFSQFNAVAGTARSAYEELPSKNIDTGAGLERIACIMQGVETNYETDLFYPLIEKIAALTGVAYTGQMAHKVIADHIRTVVFALGDGARFANEGRGYVIRRLLRRAMRFAKGLSATPARLHELVAVVVAIMKPYYTDLVAKEKQITAQIKQEEARFLKTLAAGEKRLLAYLAKEKVRVLPAAEAFLLYDTFGFPLELTEEVCRERGARVDTAGFAKLLQKQKEQSQSARTAVQSMSGQVAAYLEFTEPALFTGREELKTTAKLIALFKGGARVTNASGEVVCVFDKTPFYATSGGQIGDTGTISRDGLYFEVKDTFSLPHGQHAMIVDFGDDIATLGAEYVLAVDAQRRSDLANNHSATHLLNAALRVVIDSSIHQHGSYVGQERLRFDFNYFKLPDDAALVALEDEVNQQIALDHPVTTEIMSLAEAKATGAEALFGEKYAEQVRVVTMGYSKELCGGTHVHHTKAVGSFALLSCESKGSGIYRLEAATDSFIHQQLRAQTAGLDREAHQITQKITALLAEGEAAGVQLTADYPAVPKYQPSYRYVLAKKAYCEALSALAHELEKTLAQKLRALNALDPADFLALAEPAGNSHIIAVTLETTVPAAKDLVDRLAEHLNPGVFLVGIPAEKPVFICKSTAPAVHAGKLIQAVAKAAGGGGGGRPDFAQAGGGSPEKVATAVALGRQLAQEALCG